MDNKQLLEIFEKTALKQPFNLSENTVDRYMYYINQLLKYLNNKSISEINKNDIKLYLMSLDASDSYYNANLSAVKTLYDILNYHPSTEDIINFNPTLGIVNIKNPKTKKKQIFLTSYQQSMMIKYAKNPRDIAILKLLFSTGLRVHEMIALTIEQFNDITDNQIKLDVTKGDKGGSIWLDDEVIDAINDYLKVRKESKYENLFISNGGKPMDRTCMSRTLKTIARKTNIFTEDEIDRISNHTCRRACASTLLNEKDVPIDIVAKVLRHSNLSSVMRYAKTDDNRVKQVMCN